MPPFRVRRRTAGSAGRQLRDAGSRRKMGIKIPLSSGDRRGPDCLPQWARPGRRTMVFRAGARQGAVRGAPARGRNHSDGPGGSCWGTPCLHIDCRWFRPWFHLASVRSQIFAAEASAASFMVPYFAGKGNPFLPTLPRSRPGPSPAPGPAQDAPSRAGILPESPYFVIFVRILPASQGNSVNFHLNFPVDFPGASRYNKRTSTERSRNHDLCRYV